MWVSIIQLRNFRSHEDAEFSFEPGVNLIHGPNGIGKTNILEAIHFAALSKSFLTRSDRHALRRGCDHFRVDAVFSQNDRRDRAVQLVYAPSGGKRLRVNGVEFERLVDVVGQFPLVTISPDDHRITAGGPEERRRLLNSILCQASPAYLTELLRYRRALKQRNGLLAMGHSADPSLLAPWTNALVIHGAEIMKRRAEFVGDYQRCLDQSFEWLGTETERPKMHYRPATQREDDEWRADYQRTLDESLQADIDRKSTTRGPHRDEVLFTLDDLPVRNYGSQGQHRTFVMALRIAEHAYLKERTGVMPILLLDDVFDNLDPNRIRLFLDLLSSERMGQSIVTAARSNLFDGAGSHEINSIQLPAQSEQ